MWQFLTKLKFISCVFFNLIVIKNKVRWKKTEIGGSKPVTFVTPVLRQCLISIPPQKKGAEDKKRKDSIKDRSLWNLPVVSQSNISNWIGSPNPVIIQNCYLQIHLKKWKIKYAYILDSDLVWWIQLILFSKIYLFWWGEF